MKRMFRVALTVTLMVIAPTAFADTDRGCVPFPIDNVVEACTEIIDSQRSTVPQKVEAHKNRAQARVRDQNYDDARDDYDAIVNLTPNDAKAYIERGAFLRMNRQYDDAVDDYTKVIQLGDRKSGHLGRGLANTYAMKLDPAIADLTVAIEILTAQARRTGKTTIEDWFAFGARGYAHMLKKDYDRAIEDFTSGIAIGELAFFFKNRGFVYAQQNKLNHAIDDYNRVIRSNPNDIHALYLRADAYEKSGQQARANADRLLAQLLEENLIYPRRTGPQ